MFREPRFRVNNSHRNELPKTLIEISAPEQSIFCSALLIALRKESNKEKYRDKFIPKNFQEIIAMA